MALEKLSDLADVKKNYLVHYDSEQAASNCIVSKYEISSIGFAFLKLVQSATFRVISPRDDATVSGQENTAVLLLKTLNSSGACIEEYMVRSDDKNINLVSRVLIGDLKNNVEAKSTEKNFKGKLKNATRLISIANRMSSS